MNKITQAYREGMEEFRTKQENGDFGNPYLDADRIEKYFAIFARNLILAAKSSMPEEKDESNLAGSAQLDLTYERNHFFNHARTAALAPLDEFLEEL